MMPAAPAKLSLFALIRGALGSDFPLIRCSKATLVHISHTLEDLVLRDRIPALLFTGFQESSHWRKETERYRALAEVAQQVCIFAGGSLPPESRASELHITLAGDDPLRQEWFLCILSERFAVLLCGQDRQAGAALEAAREFDTIWSFDLEVVGLVLDRLEEVVGRYRPDRLAQLRGARARFPLRPPDPAIVTRLTSELLRYEESLNRNLLRTSHELEQQMAWRHALTETLVHDLRQPIQGMLQTLELLQECGDLDRETVSALAGGALASAANLNGMIQVILDTNRLEAGQLQLDLRAVAPGELLGEALVTARLMARLAQLRLVWEVDPSLAAIHCDRTAIGRVLQNLVGNAIKFTPAGGTVLVAVGRDGAGVRLRVSDTGVGIAPEALPQIFERYYHGGGAAGRQGSGVGLYFCRLAVEAHGGSIGAESIPGQGTTVTVTLPAR